MALLANRVRASLRAPMRASTSRTPSDAAICCTFSKSRRNSSLSPIAPADLDAVEARRAGSMSGSDHLLGLAFSAVRHAPQHPVIAVGDGSTGVPEFRGDSAVGGVLQHA